MPYAICYDTVGSIVYALCCMMYAMLYAICYMLYAICYMLYAICYMLYAICYAICYWFAALDVILIVGKRSTN
jgi:hypothetical protein